MIGYHITSERSCHMDWHVLLYSRGNSLIKPQLTHTCHILVMNDDWSNDNIGLNNRVGPFSNHNFIQLFSNICSQSNCHVTAELTRPLKANSIKFIEPTERNTKCTGSVTRNLFIPMNAWNTWYRWKLRVNIKMKLLYGNNGVKITITVNTSWFGPFINLADTQMFFSRIIFVFTILFYLIILMNCTCFFFNP